MANKPIPNLDSPEDELRHDILAILTTFNDYVKLEAIMKACFLYHQRKLKQQINPSLN